jgi:hypothetical protein
MLTGEMKQYHNKLVGAIAIASLAITTVGYLGLKVINNSKNMEKQIEIATKLYSENLDLKVKNAILSAKSESQEADIFMKEYFSFHKNLEKKAKKDNHARTLEFYLNMIEEQVKKKTSSPEEFNIQFRNNFIQRANSDPYLKNQVPSLPNSLLKYLQ